MHGFPCSESPSGGRFSPKGPGLVPFECTTYDGMLPCDCIFTAPPLPPNRPATTIIRAAVPALNQSGDRLLKQFPMK